MTNTYTQSNTLEQEMLFKTFEHAPMGMVLLELDGKLVNVNSAFCKMIGYTRQELVQLGLKSILHLDDYSSYSCKIQRLQACELSSIQLDSRFLHRHGEVIWGSLNAFKVITSQATYIIGQLTDVTVKKKTEELILQSEKLSIAGQLAAAIAHEIRNPITAIKGFMKLLQDSNEKQLYYTIVESEIERIEVILSELLSLARPQKAIFKETDLRQTLIQVISLLDAEANMKSIEVAMNFAEDLSQILCDENQIKQVFINFVKNAFDAMPDGGMLTIEAFEVISSEQSELCIRFIDTGYGIPKEILSKIGQPFYTTKEKGTGLGFMVSKNIIEDHNGVVHIKSKEKVGTTIEVILPVKNQQKTHPA